MVSFVNARRRPATYSFAIVQAPLLILLTHGDQQAGSLVSVEAVVDTLALDSHPHRGRVHVHRCAATTGAGVDEAMKHLCDSIEAARRAE